MSAPTVVVQVPLVNANLVTVALESFLYGIFFILSVLSIYLLVSHHTISERTTTMGPSRISYWSLFKKPMFLFAIALTVGCTMHWIMTVIRAFQAFIQFNGGTTPLIFYASLDQLTEVVKTGIMIACLLLGDAAIIYRLYIIYGRSISVCLFPMCTLTGLAVCGVGITYQFTQFTLGQNVFASAAGRWITSDCVFTLVTNVYSTVAIALRVMKSARSAPKAYGGASLMNVLSTLVESAAIYTVWGIFFFASYQSGSNLQFPAIDLWPQVSGISFMLINVRVGLGWAANGRLGNVTSSDRSRPGLSGGQITSVARPQWDQYGTNTARSGIKPQGNMEMGPVGGEYASRGGRPLEVNITQVMSIDRPTQYDSKVAPFDSYVDV